MKPSERIPHDVLCKLNITRGFECDCIRSEVAQLEEENALLQSIREAQANMIGKLFAEKQEPA